MGDFEPSNRKEFIYRVGTFFLLVGVGMMVFFILSDMANQAQLGYFCWGTGLLTIAFIFRAQYKKPEGPPHGRFSVLGKIRGAFKRKPKEEKKKK